MSNKEKAALVPTLRFPEFRGGKVWDEKLVSEVYCFKGSNSLARDRLNYELGTIKNIHYGDIHTKFSTHFDITREDIPYINKSDFPGTPKAENFCIEGDLIFADASEDLEGIGKAIEIVCLNGEQVVSGLHTILARQIKATFVTGFGGHLFNSKRVRAGIRRESQGAKVLGLAASRLANIKLTFPGSTSEQQRIADCLSSLDEVIATQARITDALKAHKRGLLQQLFPSEGKTQPQLRFPEFQNVEWKFKKLDLMLAETPRPIIMKDDIEYSLVTVKRRYGGVMSRKVLNGKKIKVKSQFNVKTNDFIISKRQIVHNACGLVPKELNDSIVSNEYSVLTPKKGCDIRFFNYFSQQPIVSQSFVQASAGIVIEKMLFKPGIWLRREFPFPSYQEQKRIAACLGNIDREIAAAAQELDTLKSHKNGLMQQFFPAEEAAEA